MKEILSRHNSIIHDVVTLLPLAAKTNDKGEWTEAVKSTMYQLWGKYLPGYKEEFCGFSLKRATHEWLLDVMWYPKDDSTEGVLLGLESEWLDSLKECRSDFCKLLAVKAPLKIFLFEAGKFKEEDHIQSLNVVCRKWQQHIKGDLIYAINFSDGRHTTYFYEVLKDGPIAEFQFQKIANLSGTDS